MVVSDEPIEEAADRRPGSFFGRLAPLRPGPWLMGCGLVALAPLGLVSNLRLAILLFPFNAESVRRAGWAELWSPTGLPYEQRLLIFPLVAFVILFVAGAVLIVAAYKSWENRVSAPIVVAAAVASALAGTMLALTGTRWLGFFLARVAEPGASPVVLQWVPYLNLLVGTVVAAAAFRFLIRPTTWNGMEVPRFSVLTAIVSIAGLVLIPLLPFGYANLYGRWVPLDELTIATLATQERYAWWDAPNMLSLSRIALWFVVATGLVGLAATPVVGNRSSRIRFRDRLTLILVAIAILAGLAVTIRFYLALPEIFPTIRFGPNILIPATLAALGVVAWRGKRTLVALTRQ